MSLNRLFFTQKKRPKTQVFLKGFTQSLYAILMSQSRWPRSFLPILGFCPDDWLDIRVVRFKGKFELFFSIQSVAEEPAHPLTDVVHSSSSFGGGNGKNRTCDLFLLETLYPLSYTTLVFSYNVLLFSCKFYRTQKVRFFVVVNHFVNPL